MQTYKADLHLHTVLSPCGDLEMTPSFMIRRAQECGLSIIGITDHNSTRNCAEIRRIGEREGVFVMCGAEITTQEEVHCLAFVEDQQRLEVLQAYLSEHLPRIENNPDLFGYQLVVNEQEEVMDQEEFLLISGISQTINQIEQFVHGLGGLFIPAHIDKMQNSLLSQLGFLPPDLNVDALEISPKVGLDEFLSRNKMLARYRARFISSSDAHYPQEFSRRQTLFNMESLCFAEVRAALAGHEGRSLQIVEN